MNLTPATLPPHKRPKGLTYYRPTMDLRWFGGVLQQRFTDDSQKYSEWRKVPRVGEEPRRALPDAGGVV